MTGQASGGVACDKQEREPQGDFRTCENRILAINLVDPEKRRPMFLDCPLLKTDS
ncbi:hypothetical protein SAMN05216412_107136 [Nitrosospira multiformis]|uniref:Uncharacterized protein n=1 Tax=Nitrosospira multiformis TaxID=1231 RepID=A0A1I0EY45_9PROT|nr:hypothetical protein SAMN05216412_107136 [Nitrosospira multiformis]